MSRETPRHDSVTTSRATTCLATDSSLTPRDWHESVRPDSDGVPRSALRLVRDVPLPGPANRFDYQSVDPRARRLYISHMGAGRLVVFDLDSMRVSSPRWTGSRA